MLDPTRIVTPGETMDPSYDALDRLTRAGTKTYAYEDNGNQTSAGTRTFTYDLENRLLSTTQGGVTGPTASIGMGTALRRPRSPPSDHYQ